MYYRMIVNENNRVVQFGHGIIDADGRKLVDVNFRSMEV